MVNPYSGQPRHLVMTNAPIIEITDSDCDNKLIPETVTVGEQILPKADEDHRRFWREVIATYVMHEGKFWPSLKRDMAFGMARFPEGYELYVSNREAHTRFDFHLYGFKPDGTHWRFTSPADFVMHAKWLAFGRPRDACGCQYCSDASQRKISKKLKAATNRVKMPSITSTRSKGSRKRKAPTNPKPGADRRRRLDPAEIRAKDYTDHNSYVSGLHKQRLERAKLDRYSENLEQS